MKRTDSASAKPNTGRDSGENGALTQQENTRIISGSPEAPTRNATRTTFARRARSDQWLGSGLCHGRPATQTANQSPPRASKTVRPNARSFPQTTQVGRSCRAAAMASCGGAEGMLPLGVGPAYSLRFRRQARLRSAVRLESRAAVGQPFEADGNVTCTSPLTCGGNCVGCGIELDEWNRIAVRLKARPTFRGDGGRCAARGLRCRQTTPGFRRCG